MRRWNKREGFRQLSAIPRAPALQAETPSGLLQRDALTSCFLPAQIPKGTHYGHVHLKCEEDKRYGAVNACIRLLVR